MRHLDADRVLHGELRLYRCWQCWGMITRRHINGRWVIQCGKLDPCEPEGAGLVSASWVEYELAMDYARATDVAAAYPELAQYAPDEFKPRAPATDEEIRASSEMLFGD